MYKRYSKIYGSYQQKLDTFLGDTRLMTKDNVDKIQAQFTALQEQQEPLANGFRDVLSEAKVHLCTNPDEIVRLADKDETGHSLEVYLPKDLAKHKENLLQEWTAWTERYTEFMQNLGAWSPVDVEALLAKLDGCVGLQRQISRALALDCGNRAEGNLRDVALVP